MGHPGARGFHPGPLQETDYADRMQLAEGRVRYGLLAVSVRQVGARVFSLPVVSIPVTAG